MTKKIKTKKHEGTLTILIEGGFNADLVQSFRAIFEDIDTSDKQIIIDLSAAEYVDSAVLGLLIHMKKKFTNSKLENIRISNCNSRIRKVFETMQFHEMFEIDMLED